MTVRVYRSSDVGAPVLTGQQGTLINLLSACLTGPSFNGTGNAYGSIPCAGWSRPFIGTNLAAYQQPATANQRFLLVDDTTADSISRVTGYESMTSISVGTNPFPAPSQQANSKLFVMRSSTFDSTPRPWTIVATDKMFYIFVNANSQNPITGSALGNPASFCFGDFISVQPGDTYNTIIIGAVVTSITQGSCLYLLSSNPVVNTTGHYVNRSYSQIGGSFGIAACSDIKSQTNGMGAAGLSVPNAADGNLYVSPVTIIENVSPGLVLRGTIPGLWALCHNGLSFLNDGDQISGITGLPGKVLEARFATNGAASPGIGVILVEISNTW